MVERKFSQERIPVMSAGEIPRIQFSSGNAKALQDFSRSMFSLSNQFEDQLDQTAQAEATVEGGLAGASGTMPELRTYETIRGRAFNQAATETFITTMDTNSIMKVQELSALHAADPAALDRSIDDYSRGVVSELEKVNPAAAATMKQRLLMRKLPVVEAAKDTAFRLTKDQADAAIIENQTALKSEIKTYANDLFSDNPERSSAAVAAIGTVQDDYMRIYQAKDPTTGRPLYSMEEQAKAKVKFYADVMENASLSWFESQPDKAAAYLKFTSPEFKINLQKPGAEGVKFIDQTAGKVRNKPILPKVRHQLATAAAATDPRLSIVLVSGGQPGIEEGGPRTGSTRHDHGGSADVQLAIDGKVIKPGENKALYAKFLENAAAAGATGIGHYSWGVHIGGGSRAAWGPNTSSNTLDPDFAAAIQRGWDGAPLDGKAVSTTLDLRKSLPPEVTDRIESEMRARMTFQNQLADREEKIAEKNLKAEQDLTEFEFTNRLYGAGTKDPETGVALKPLTREEITLAARNGFIDSAKAAAISKAMATEKPMKSDQPTYREALKRLYSNEDIRDFVLLNPDKFSDDDAAALLAKNQSMNVEGDGLNEDQKFYQSQLEKLLTPDSALASIDEGRQMRRFSAMDEYRKRVKDGENPRDVSEDVANRARVDFNTLDSTALGSLVRPRFAVQDTAKGGNRIDVQASAKALFKAHQDKRISDEYFEQEKARIKKFADIQTSLEATDATKAEEKKTKGKK